jgi:hypothetical protein
MVKRTLSPVAEAYERCKEARNALHALDNARCMEVTEDKAGILWERWVLLYPNSHAGVILYATPHGWDLYVPLTRDQDINATLDALRALAAK